MKLKYRLMTGLAVLAVFTGCVNPDGSSDRTGTGALAGAGAGAITGARYGGGGGALIGAAVGVVTGGIIGHVLDWRHRERLQQEAPQTYVRVDQNQPLQVADVKALVQSGVTDDVIISQIRNSRTVYHLSSPDIIDLHNSGVSEKLLDFMINTPNTIGATAMAPVAPPQNVVIQGPPPPAPVETVVVRPGPDYVWVGGEWVWNDGWAWSAGRWVYPPRPHVVWVAGYWGHGSGGGWRRYPGHWR